MPPKILTFVHAHIKNSQGGTEHAAFSLHNEINRRYPNHSFIATPKRESNSSQPNEYQIETTANPFTLQAEHPDQRNAQLIKLIEDIQPNIIHFQHFIQFGIDAIEFIKGRFPGIKIVLTLHEYLLLCPNQGQMIKHRLNTICDQPGANSCHQCFPGQSIDALHCRELASQRALLCCDAVISPSEYLIEQFRQHRKLPPHQIVIENGLPGGIKVTTKLQSRLSDDLNHFGFFGKVSELKGIIVLLQAIYKLKQKIDKPFFVHINGGGLEQQPVLIQTRVRNLLRACGDRVNLKGAYQQDQIPDLMQECDWVVVPSIWWENSPVVIQEAFACQRPVLGTDHGGIHEKIVDKGGIGFSCGDSSSLAACMQSALGNQELHTKLRREIQPLTTASICADQHLNLYNSLLSTHD